MVSIAQFETIKELAFGGISAAYANVGSATTNQTRSFTISNNTEGDMFFSINGNDQFFLAAGSFRLLDVQANMNAQKDDKYVLPVGTQFQVKQITAPVSGSVYIEIMF